MNDVIMVNVTQANQATSYLDGSQIYGSEDEAVRKLRAQSGGGRGRSKAIYQSLSGLLMTSFSSSPDHSMPLVVGHSAFFLKLSVLSRHPQQTVVRVVVSAMLWAIHR